MFKETTITKSADILVDGHELGDIKVEAHKNGETYCKIAFTISIGYVGCSTIDAHKGMDIDLRYQEDKDALCRELEYGAKGILSLVEFINSSCPQLPTKPEPKTKEEEIKEILEKTDDIVIGRTAAITMETLKKDLQRSNLSPEESC